MLCKIWGANRVYYGEFENSQWDLFTSGDFEEKGIGTEMCPATVSGIINGDTPVSFWLSPPPPPPPRTGQLLAIPNPPPLSLVTVTEVRKSCGSS